MEISATAKVDLTENGGNVVTRLVHAISISQPIQSWTVIREHDHFLTLGDALSTSIGGIPSCPVAPAFDSCGSSSHVDEIVKVRNAAQKWLSNVLLFPGARQSPAVNQFLCYGANHIPTMYQRVNWINFTSSSHTASSNSSSLTSQNQNSGRGEAEELEMDEMFGYGDGPIDDNHAHDEGGYYEEEDAEYFSAAERYQPTEEEVTQDDVMEFQNNVDDVEMIEDVGSLAQSLGASHLGRSLQLQAEMSGGRPSHTNLASTVQPQQGLNIGDFEARSNNEIKGVGGIGNAVAKALVEAKVEGLGTAFSSQKPISAPKLDSFKMIKVVGKGSFGKIFGTFRFICVQSSCNS